MKQKTQHIVTRLQGYWQRYWLLRWTIANFVGWGLGLIAVALTMWLSGLFGMFLSGAIIGLCMAIPQAWVLFADNEMPTRRKWVLYTSVGGFFAIFPAGILMLLSIFNLWIAAILAGMIFSGIIAFMQSFVLVSLIDDRALLWIPTGILAGAVAALLTVPILLTPIPLYCSPASLVFALMTGCLMLRWMDED